MQPRKKRTLRYHDELGVIPEREKGESTRSFRLQTVKQNLVLYKCCLSIIGELETDRVFYISTWIFFHFDSKLYIAVYMYILIAELSLHNYSNIRKF